MQKELYERIGILEDNEIISGKVADYARKIVDYILFRCPGVPQDKMEMFVTHLAMAGKRAEERTEENPLDEGILAAVKTEVVFPKAVEIRDRILSMTDIVFSETEKDFLSVYLCSFVIKEVGNMRIVVGGQIDKEEIAGLVKKQLGDGAEVTVKGDLDAAMGMKSGIYDYYVGACNTGGGGALAMALALLGKARCATISMPGHVKSDEEIEEEVKTGKVAFGFTAQHKEEVLPVLLNAFVQKARGTL